MMNEKQIKYNGEGVFGMLWLFSAIVVVIYILSHC